MLSTTKSSFNAINRHSSDGIGNRVDGLELMLAATARNVRSDPGILDFLLDVDAATVVLRRRRDAPAFAGKEIAAARGNAFVMSRRHHRHRHALRVDTERYYVFEQSCDCGRDYGQQQRLHPPKLRTQSASLTSSTASLCSTDDVESNAPSVSPCVVRRRHHQPPPRNRACDVFDISTRRHNENKAVVRSPDAANAVGERTATKIDDQHATFTSSSSVAQTDDDEDEVECAISDLWRFEAENRRWSRMPSSSASSPMSPPPLAANLTHPFHDVSNHHEIDPVISEELFGASNLPDARGADADENAPTAPAKFPPRAFKAPKSAKHNFLKRVGSDFKKLRAGSFRRKDGADDAATAAPTGERRRNRALVIGEPVLTSGQERLAGMRCVAIDSAVGGDCDVIAATAVRARKNSSHSLLSTSSSSASGSTTSTPSAPSIHLVRRQQGSDPDIPSPPTSSSSSHPHDSSCGAAPLLRSTPSSENIFFTPHGHVPGTFPSMIREKSDASSSAFDDSVATSPVSSQSSVDFLAAPLDVAGAMARRRPVSVYDNLPPDASASTAQDLLNMLQSPPPAVTEVDDSGIFVSQESLATDDPAAAGTTRAGAGGGRGMWSVDDIVEHTQSLQEMVRSWEEDLEDHANGEELFGGGELPSFRHDNDSNTDDELDHNGTSCGEDFSRCRSRFRWQSFHRDHRRQMLETVGDATHIHNLSAGQLMVLRRLSLLRLTALMESYALSTTTNNKSWSMPRFIRRVKVPDYKDKTVFGIPLVHNVRKSGQPLPTCVIQALAHLRRNAVTQVGLFRKPGVRSRIAKLRALCEARGVLALFDECSAYDVADMVKCYFRELPDPLMTAKLSDTFMAIFLYVPDDLRLQTLQAAVMLLPDENREALTTLICFLCDVASKSNENQMTASNLATCFAPSLFYQQYSAAANPTKSRKQQSVKSTAVRGIPDRKEMDENRAANECVAFMIDNVDKLFTIPEDAMTQCRISVMQQAEDVLAAEIGYSPADVSGAGDCQDFYDDFRAYVDRQVAQGAREEARVTQGKGGWQTIACPNGCDLTCKKVNDGNPLRLWRCRVDGIGASVSQVMDRVLHERHLWDDDLIEWKVLQQPDERTQLFQIVTDEMSPHPRRDFCVLRSWRTNVPNTNGAAAIVETSSGNHPLLGDVRGVVLTSRYLIEPTAPGCCAITHVCRVDLKGRNPEWYNKSYGHVVAQQLFRVRDSLKLVAPRTLLTDTGC